MQLLKRLRDELARARQIKASKGLAMLLVVIVLSTLLIVGVLFTVTASLDVQASAYYRQTAQARLFALEGLYRAIAELYYDVWGVNESEAFVCADADDPATRGAIEGTLKDAAYYSDLTPPTADDPGGMITAPWSKWRRSTVGKITSPRVNLPVLTDFRWMVEQPDDRGTKIWDGWTKRPSGTHSGAPYHDEFLPEYSDNSDVWELGVHLNSGDVFGRSWRNDSKRTGGLWSAGSWCEMPLRWPGKREFEEFDYIDTRIVGDSFHKIFRFELIDPGTRRSYAAGLDPVTGRYMKPRFTHIGDATQGTYNDSRGGAININQVNNNYQWELYWAGQTTETVKMYHYPESKWIYVYNTEGDRKLGRYGAMVWPDGGCPNANMQYDTSEVTSTGWAGTVRHSSDYLLSLDWGFSPHGGPFGGTESPAVNNIVSEIVEGYEADAWYIALGTRIGDYKGAEGTDFGDAGGGLITSRAEMNMFVRKACFTEDANGGVAGWTPKEAAWDAHIISSLVTVNGYEYLLDHHWSNDRLVLDKLGLGAAVLGVTSPKTTPIPSPTSFFASGETRSRYYDILDDLRFTYGPYHGKEGAYTPYHDPGEEPGTMRSKLAKATPISWLAHMWFYTRNDFQSQGERPYGISFKGVPKWENKVLTNDVLGDPYLVVNRTDFPLISEVGWYIFPGQDWDVIEDKPSDPPTVRGRTPPWGWLDYYRPDGGVGFSDTNGNGKIDDAEAKAQGGQVYFDMHQRGLMDGGTPKYFVELVKYWEMDSTHSVLNLDSNYHLYVVGGTVRTPKDILSRKSSWPQNEDYCKTTRVIGIDEKGLFQGGNEYDLECEKDWVPKVVPTQEDYRGQAGSPWYRGRCAAERLGGATGRGSHTYCLVSFNKYRGNRTTNSQDAWPESWNKAHPANYLLITFDGAASLGHLGYDRQMTDLMRNAVKPDAGGRTTIVLTWKEYVLDVAHLPRVGFNADDPSLTKYSNVFECGFDAFDPVNNHGYASWYDRVGLFFTSQWAPNYLDSVEDMDKRATPPWRGFSEWTNSYAPGFPGSGRPLGDWLKMAKAGRYWDNRPGKSARDKRWLDGLNYHTIMAYLPGGQQFPAGMREGQIPYTISDVSDGTGAVSMVASGSNALTTVWGGRGGARDWEGLAKAPTGFWPEYVAVLDTGPADNDEQAPDPFLRFWGDLMRVTPLERVVTAGYMGNYGDNIAALSEHSIYDEFDNDMDGHIDNLTSKHIRSGPPGHYLADRKTVGRLNLNELQHPAAIWYGSFCMGKFGSQTLFAGRKPFKGYTTWFDCLRRGVYYKESQYGPTVQEPYNMIFWYENQYGDCSSDHTHCGRMIEEAACWDIKHTSRILYSGNSPVYTVYVTGQVLRDSKDPIAETKLRATVERTWDGKMNILEFCWIPRDIMMED